MSKFIEIKPNDNASKKNGWFEECRRKNMPYVTVTSRGSIATVDWDYISYPDGSEKIFEAKEACIKAELKKIYDKYSTEKSKYSFSACSANISGLSTQDAKSAAEEIHDLISDVINDKRC